MGHHPHQQKISWNCVVKLLRYISQRLQNKGQSTLTNNAVGSDHLSGRYDNHRQQNLILCESRKTIVFSGL